MPLSELGQASRAADLTVFSTRISCHHQVQYQRLNANTCIVAAMFSGHPYIAGDTTVLPILFQLYHLTYSIVSLDLLLYSIGLTMIENSCLISQFSTVVIRCMNNFCKIGEKPGKEQMTSTYSQIQLLQSDEITPYEHLSLTLSLTCIRHARTLSDLYHAHQMPVPRPCTVKNELSQQHLFAVSGQPLKMTSLGGQQYSPVRKHPFQLVPSLRRLTSLTTVRLTGIQHLAVTTTTL